LIREAPRIETDRLVLRQHRKEDFPAHHRIMDDHDVMRHVGGVGGREDCWRRFAGAVGSWALIGFGGWAVVRRSNDQLVGIVSLFNAWRDMEPQFGEDPEMGWIFAKEAHGQGIASEACIAALAWADQALPPRPIWAIVAPENEPSLKLAERLGFERLADSVYKDEPTAVLRRSPAASATTAATTA
jgi:RimJ/RimL family protein N-acetyltransferase